MVRPYRMFLGVCGALTLLCGAIVPTAIAQGGKDKKPGKERQTGKTEPKKPNPNAPTVLLFSTETKGGVTDQLVDAIVRVEQRRLRAEEEYKAIEFSRAMPTIRRALTDQSLTNADVERPFQRTDKLKKLAKIAGYKMVMTSAITDYQYDAAKHKVTLDLSISLIDFSGDKPVIKLAAETGSTPAGAPENADEVKLALDAVRDLAEKLMTEILKPKPTVTEEKKN